MIGETASLSRAWSLFRDPVTAEKRRLLAERWSTLDPAVKPMFAYAFDKMNPFYRKLRRARAYKAIERRRVLGAPLRIGQRWYARVREAVRRVS